MNTYSRNSLQQALQNQVRRLSDKIEELDQLSSRLSMARLGTFVGGLVLIYLAGTFGPEWLFWLSVVAFIGGFWKLIDTHNHVDHAIDKFTIWRSIRSKHIARLQLNWPHIPERQHSSKNYTNHPFANDLDLIGSHSLLQLIDTSTYDGSTDQLCRYLLNREPDWDEIENRQAIVKELAAMPQFRDRLHLRAEINTEQEHETDWSLDELRRYLHQSKEVNYTLSLSVLGFLSLSNIVLGALYLAGMIDPYVIFSFILYLVIYNFNSEKISGLYEESHQIGKLLTQFNAVLNFLENYDYAEKSHLKKFCRIFWENDDSPSRYVNKIIRIAGAASSQQSEVIWVLVNFLMPWDLYFTQKLSSYKKKLAPYFSEWVDHVYKLEACSSMANFAWLHPHYSFTIPDKHAEQPFRATNLGHPLIPEKQKVTNDVAIEQKGSILLITGSNMAGKSTFLRTMGINLALCFAGAPVNAKTLSTIPFRLFCSINVTDSLDDGLSHFYAEVKRLRELLDLLQDNHKTPVFFMVDEIYRGTNNRERLQGSKAFLKQVAGQNGVGLVSTHDLELAQLEEEIPRLSNYHFAETLHGDKMSFKYKLKSGPCPTTNALKIMEMEGLPTSIKNERS